MMKSLLLILGFLFVVSLMGGCSQTITGDDVALSLKHSPSGRFHSDLIGVSSVLPNGTLAVSGYTVKLYGVEFPDPKQCCYRKTSSSNCVEKTSDGLHGIFTTAIGAQAVRSLRTMVQDQEVRCLIVNPDTGERDDLWRSHKGTLEGQCFVESHVIGGTEVDIAEQLVLGGKIYADNVQSSLYSQREVFAKNNDLGIWKCHHTSLRPSEWKTSENRFNCTRLGENPFVQTETSKISP